VAPPEAAALPALADPPKPAPPVAVPPLPPGTEEPAIAEAPAEAAVLPALADPPKPAPPRPRYSRRRIHRAQQLLMVAAVPPKPGLPLRPQF